MLEPKRVFVLGMDAASFDLVSRWSSEGRLPEFRRLMQQGSSGVLESLPVPNSAAAWSSIVTGLNPGEHGILDFYEPLDGSYDIRFLCGADRRGSAIWRIVSEAGLKTVVVNVPLTYPAEAVNGAMIAGLDAPGVESRGFCYPSQLLDELNRAVGPYLFHPGMIGHFIAGNIDGALEQLVETTNRRLEVVRYLMGNRDWHLFMVVFSALDSVQHCFWKFFDSEHPEYTPEGAAEYGEVIPQFYERLDKVLANITAAVPEDCVLLIVSDHGFGIKHRVTHQLNDWLASLGLLRRDAGTSTHSLLKRCLRSSYMALERRLSRRGKETLIRLFPGLRNAVRSRMAYADIDWGATQAYSDNISPALRINLAGREPKGQVGSAAEYEQLLTRLTEELDRCFDPRSGHKAVSRVYRREEIFRGTFAHKAPDLIVEWNREHFIEALSEGLPPPVPPTGEFRVVTGDHRPNGTVILFGPGIRATAALEGATLYDVAPTVLHLLGLPVPEEMGGRVLKEALTDAVAVRRERAARTEVTRAGERAPERTYTPEETAALRDRLRGLGYVE